jgi:hypothetical protein
MSDAYDTHESETISPLHAALEYPMVYQRRSITLLDVRLKTRITPSWACLAMEFDRIPVRSSSLFCRSIVKNAFIDPLIVIRRKGC